MLFNSIEFGIFLPLVFILYWFVFNRNLRIQNAFLLIVSYVFYGWWDWRFLSLVFLSTLIDYIVGYGLSKTNNPRSRKLLLLLSITANLGLLGFFKYFNFFAESFVDAFTLLGYSFNAPSLRIILPVGISFYTFQTLSYSIDVYRRKLEPTKDFIAFSAFVTFFPQLVAGPIERATALLSQFFEPRKFSFSDATDGMRQILWGLFKKIVIADNCATFANDIFSNYSSQPGLVLILGAFFFAFQIYGDFSGYSDIAIGTSRLFGFRLMRNFAYPYFSRDIAEFWRRWHISLSTWFRDYVYIPLGGSKISKALQIRNTIIIFTISGFWHGANWTFIAWGLLNAIYFLPLLAGAKNRSNLGIVAHGKLFPTFRDFSAIIFTFMLTLIAWIFFRANSLFEAINYIWLMITGITDSPSMILPYISSYTFVLILLFTSLEWLQREREHALNFDHLKIPTSIKWSIYYLLILIIFIFGGSQQNFIYFQF